jgi:hypothetical protein
MFLLLLLAGASAVGATGCHPQCRWACDDPVCTAVCAPHCQPPRCQIQCNNHSNVTEDDGLGGNGLYCSPPSCSVRCPQDMCESEMCPQCETVCLPPACSPHHVAHQAQCQVLCEATQCDWQCRKPAIGGEGEGGCRPPRCELQCERPACETPQQQPLPSRASKLGVGAALVVALML